MDVPELMFRSEDVESEEEFDDPEACRDQVLQELAQSCIPYLLEGVDASVATRLLKQLGIRTMSDVSQLTEADLVDIMAPVQCRKWLADQKGTKKRRVGNSFSLGRCISTSLNETLCKPEMLEPAQRRLVIHVIGDYVKSNWTGTFKAEHSLVISKQLCENYKFAFGLMESATTCSSDFKVLVQTLSNELLDHVRYLHGKDIRNDSGAKSKRGKRFNKYQEYALIPEEDRPVALPPGETLETLEEKRVAMVRMSEDSSIYVKQQVLRYMDLTYVLQRTDVNGGKAVPDLLERWPYLGLVEVMEKAFMRVTKLPPELAVGEKEADVVAKWIPYLQYLSHQKRKGSSAGIPKLLSVVFKDSTYKEQGLFTVLRCLVLHLGISTDKFFICFEDTTSFDEVQASHELPDDGRPILAILGSTHLPTRKAFVVVEKSILNRVPLGLRQAIHLLFQSYYYFKITYDIKMAPVLEFFQRKIYEIDEPGTRSDRKVTPGNAQAHAPSSINRTYAHLQKAFCDYRSRFSYD